MTYICTIRVTLTGLVEAVSEEEARRKAEQLDWADCDTDSWVCVDAVPEEEE